MRTTFTLNDTVYKALKIRAAETGEPMSAIVEQAVQAQLLEDAEDLEDALQRQNEPTLPFDTLVRDFKAAGLL